jgi:Mn-dependent DtxR family transcriptional regulator
MAAEPELMKHVDTWKHFEENELTHSAAHYLMAIDTLMRQNGYARVSDVARFLEVTTGSASVSLRSLKERGFVDVDANRFLQLTEAGAGLAHRVEVNRQMLIALFRDVIGVDGDSAEIDACKIEHLLSDMTRERLRIFLAFMRSEKKEARGVTRALREFEFECPGLESCDVCEETCQFADITEASKNQTPEP